MVDLLAVLVMSGLSDELLMRIDPPLFRRRTNAFWVRLIPQQHRLFE